MGLIWTRKLSIGNAIIDDEHRNLIRMTRDVVHEIRNGDTASLLEAINLLESWLHLHFANEEKIGLAIGFDFKRHAIGQQHLLKEFHLMRKELTDGNTSWSGGTIKYFSRHLKNWMIDEHIIRLDMRMKPALLPHGYGCLPKGKNAVARQIRNERQINRITSSAPICLQCRPQKQLPAVMQNISSNRVSRRWV